MVPSSSPASAIARPFSMEPPVRLASVVSPSTISAKYSGGPKVTAQSASGGAASISSTTLSVPAMNDPIAAIPSAAPARPLSAIW
ncbi:hypothetical protein D3C83_62150 [compost metagenome]